MKKNQGHTKILNLKGLCNKLNFQKTSMFVKERREIIIWRGSSVG